MSDQFWLAPMHGITHFPFRNSYLKHFQGVDKVIAPFIPAQLLEQQSLSSKKDLFLENNPYLPVIPQIMGTNEQQIVDTILFLTQHFHYTQYNWNIGCPMKNITKKNRGCGIMRFPEQVEAVVQHVIENTNCRFSVKMRLGMDNIEQGEEIIERLNPYPLDFMVVHPRFGLQLYEGNVHLDLFDHFYQKIKHPIIYSGDINNVAFFNHLKNRYPKIKQWMLGRGLLQNPFILEKIKGISSSESEKVRFFQFYDELYQSLLSQKNENVVLGIIKELWKYFYHFFKLDDEKITLILRSQSIVELEVILKRLKNL